MVENSHAVTTNQRHSGIEKKDKNPPRIKRRKSKSEGKNHKSGSNKKDRNEELEWNPNTDKFSPSTEWETELQRKDSKASNASTWDPEEFQQQTNKVDAWGEEPTRLQDLPSPTLAEVPSGQRSGKKGKRSSKKKTERSRERDRKASPPRRKNTASDDEYDVVVYDDEVEEREKKRSTSRSLGYSGRKEDKRPSAPHRATDRGEVEDYGVDKPPSKPRSRSSLLIGSGEEKRATKTKTKNTERTSSDNEQEDELGVNSFHSLRIDADKPRTKSSSSKKRSSNSTRRTRTPTGGRQSRRRAKDKAVDYSEDLSVDKSVDSADDVSATQEEYLKDEQIISRESSRARSDRLKERDRPASNDASRDPRRIDSTGSPGNRFGRSSLSRRGGIRRSHSERWNKAGQSAEAEGAEDLITRRAQESLSRSNDGLSRSGHQKLRRHHSSGLTRMTGTMNPRSFHGADVDRRTPTDGRRTPRRAMRRHQKFDSAASVGEESANSFGEARSQGTLDSIDDFEDFGEDFYGMELQTPGMINFEDDLIDLMQRANPEVTDHLDRRVHRKREMVAFDHNMPMMTRQALLTRQASSQIQRQFFDGSNIDKKRLLLRNDSSHSHDGLGMSNHRPLRNGRRAPPRARSSGLGSMGRVGYSDSLQPESDDHRRVFRSRSMQSGQPASFHQQNKPNKVRSVARRSSGDLRGNSRGSDHVTRHQALQRHHSSASIRKSSSSDQFAPRQPQRKNSKEKNRRDYFDSGSETDESSSYGSPGSSSRRSTRRDTGLGSPKKHSSLNGKARSAKVINKNDMSNKRNRTKLHMLMYQTKMSVDMDVLFRKAREGEITRSPIDSLRMPSP